MTIVATYLLTAMVNHEYQHDQWIGEVRGQNLGHPLPDDPTAGWPLPGRRVPGAQPPALALEPAMAERFSVEALR